jgi:serine/threonine protein kinase
MPPPDRNRPADFPAADVNTAASPTTPVNGPARSERLLAGKHVGGYELVQRIGRGGLGDVYRARHEAGGAEVALKLLRGGEESTPAELRSFERECEVARRLSHPFILPILDAGVHDDCPFYTMPLITGGSLEKRLRRGPVDPEWGAVLLAKVARAVHSAHRRGVLHRDLKPANILLDGDEPLIADFGLAKLLDHASCFTVTGQVMGSVPYMAPEQAAGQSHRATPATDVWSLGVVLYEILAGQRPFRGSTHTDVLHHIQHSEPPRPNQLRPGVPAELERICRKCLDKDPQWRYASAGELAGDLEAWLANKEIGTTLSLTERLPALRGVKVRPRPALALSCLGLLAVAALLLLSQSKPAASPEPGGSDAASSFAAVIGRAQPGETVPLVVPGKRLRWSGFVLGSDEAKLTIRKAEPAWLNTPSICMLELLPPDPARGDYRLSVTLAHTDGEAVSQVGVYAGRKDLPHNAGIGQSLVQATFCEPLVERLDVKPPADPRLTLATVYLSEDRGSIPNHRVQTRRQITLPAEQAHLGAVPFRTLILEVRSGETSIGRANGPVATSPRKELLWHFQFLRRNRPELKLHQPDFSPAGGAGLIIYRGTIVVQRVLFEPLPARK